MKALAVIVVALAAALGGCQSATLAHQSCAERHARYLPMWDCIKAEMVTNRAGGATPDLRLRYMAAGDALAEQVKAGQITDAAAKYALAAELTTANSELQNRRRSALASMPRSTTCSRDLNGNVNCTSY